MRLETVQLAGGELSQHQALDVLNVTLHGTFRAWTIAIGKRLQDGLMVIEREQMNLANIGAIDLKHGNLSLQTCKEPESDAHSGLCAPADDESHDPP